MREDKVSRSGLVRVAERKIIEAAFEEHAREEFKAELATMRMVIPDFDQDYPRGKGIPDDLIEVHVQECPDGVYLPGLETLRKMVYGIN